MGFCFKTQKYRGKKNTKTKTPRRGPGMARMQYRVDAAVLDGSLSLSPLAPGSAHQTIFPAFLSRAHFTYIPNECRLERLGLPWTDAQRPCRRGTQLRARVRSPDKQTQLPVHTVQGLCLTQPSKENPHLREAHVASKWWWPPRLPWALARGGDASDGADDHRELPHPEGLFQETGRALDGEKKRVLLWRAGRCSQARGCSKKLAGEGAQARKDMQRLQALSLSRDGQGEQPWGNGGPSLPSA